MPLQLFYGGFPHAIDEPTITIDVSTNFNQANFAISRIVQWNIRGVMLGFGPVALAAQQILMEQAYQIPFQDFVLVDTTTGAVLQSLRNNGSISGVRLIKPPSFPKGDGAEFATGRTYEIIAQAEYELNAPTGLSDYSETVSYGGGGPAFGMVTCISGPPVKIVMAESVPYTATQTGYAVGRLGYPFPNAPIWPDALANAGTIEKASPKRNGFSFRDWRVSWNYSFTSAVPLVADPALWEL